MGKVVCQAKSKLVGLVFIEFHHYDEVVHDLVVIDLSMEGTEEEEEDDKVDQEEFRAQMDSEILFSQSKFYLADFVAKQLVKVQP